MKGIDFYSLVGKTICINEKLLYRLEMFDKENNLLFLSRSSSQTTNLCIVKIDSIDSIQIYLDNTGEEDNLGFVEIFYNKIRQKK